MKIVDEWYAGQYDCFYLSGSSDRHEYRLVNPCLGSACINWKDCGILTDEETGEKISVGCCKKCRCI